MRILIAEDYAPIRRAVCKGLEEAGFAVDFAEDGERALHFVQEREYDVVVLDLMLPLVDGMSVLATIRDTGSDTRVIVLSAKSEVDDRIDGLNCGADDYMVKPFDFSELLARIRSLTRRRYSAPNPQIHVGDLVVDTALQRALRSGQTIELTRREFALLEYLAVRQGQIVSRHEIWEHVYDAHADASSSNVVDVYIGYLRKKIERTGSPKLIHTKRGQGYWLGEQK